MNSSTDRDTRVLYSGEAIGYKHILEKFFDDSITKNKKENKRSRKG